MRPCRKCPFHVDSRPGATGDLSPSEFLSEAVKGKAQCCSGGSCRGAELFLHLQDVNLIRDSRHFGLFWRGEDFLDHHEQRAKGAARANHGRYGLPYVISFKGREAWITQGFNDLGDALSFASDKHKAHGWIFTWSGTPVEFILNREKDRAKRETPEKE